MARQFLPGDEAEREFDAFPDELVFTLDEPRERFGPIEAGDSGGEPPPTERPGRPSHAPGRGRSNTLPLPPHPPRQAHGVRASTSQDRGSSIREGVAREGDVLLGKYAVERVAGRVGPAIVLNVRHIDLGQRLWLKYLPAEVCGLPEVVGRFLRGARAALQLTSEHTAQTLDAGRLKTGLPYVVSELVEGAELREVLRVRGPLPVSDAIDWILQAAEAVAEAHRRNLVHGSLNPSNLFVAYAPDGSPRVKVLDFGIAEVLRADLLGTTEFPSGSQAFSDAQRRVEILSCTAPEQVRRPNDVDARTDVWALGAILHEMLTGYPVHAAENVTALLAMIVADPAPPLSAHRPDMPARLEGVVLRCLEKERSARFESVAELASALKPFASPDARLLADRILRTLGRSLRPGSSMPNSRALVHVGPASLPPTSVPAPPQPSTRFQLMWSTGLVAFGLVGGAIAGSIATRGALSTEARPAPVAAAEPVAVRSVSVDSARPARDDEAEGIADGAASAPLPTPKQPAMRSKTRRLAKAAPAEPQRVTRAEPYPEDEAARPAARASNSLFDEMR